MKLKDTMTAAQLAADCGGELIGDGRVLITGCNEIHHVEAGDLCFVDHPKYYDKTLQSAASVILIDRAYDCPKGKALVVTNNPFAVYNSVVWRARPQGKGERDERGNFVHPTAVLDTSVRLGKDCHIGPRVVIGDGCVLGDRVTVMAGTVIGEEAFYFKKTADGYLPWRSGGAVRLADDVSIGPNCTIARGVSAVTSIGRGTKLDAMVQIGHDCRIGEHCLLAAQVGVAGNTTIGDWCVLLGQVGVAQNVTIGARALIAAKSGVSKDLAGDEQYFGYPAQRLRDQLREWAAIRRLARRKND